MTDENNKEEEDLLRTRFAELKRDDRRHQAAPPFESMWRSPPARSPMRVIVPVVSALAAAAVLLIYCGVSSLSSLQPMASAPSPNNGGGAGAAGGGGGAIGGESPPPVTAQMYGPLPLDFLLETSSASNVQSRSPLHGW